MPSTTRAPTLTPRQLEILRLIAQGKRMKEIAAELESLGPDHRGPQSPTAADARRRKHRRSRQVCRAAGARPGLTPPESPVARPVLSTSASVVPPDAPRRRRCYLLPSARASRHHESRAGALDGNIGRGHGNSASGSARGLPHSDGAGPAGRNGGHEHSPGNP